MNFYGKLCDQLCFYVLDALAVLFTFEVLTTPYKKGREKTRMFSCVDTKQSPINGFTFFSAWGPLGGELLAALLPSIEELSRDTNDVGQVIYQPSN